MRIVTICIITLVLTACGSDTSESESNNSNNANNANNANNVNNANNGGGLQPGEAGTGRLMFFANNGSEEDRLEVWDLDQGARIFSHTPPDTIANAEISPDGSTVAWKGRDETGFVCRFARLDDGGEIEDCTPESQIITMNVFGASNSGSVAMSWRTFQGLTLNVGVFENGELNPWWTAEPAEILAVTGGMPPDGESIVFERADTDLDEFSLIRVDASGVEEVLYEYPENLRGSLTNEIIDFSSNGQRLVVTTAQAENANVTALAFDLSTSTATEYPLVRAPQISPDGTQIYAEATSGQLGLYAFGQTDITRELAPGFLFTWSPDGSRFAYRSSEDDPFWDVFTAPVDTPFSSAVQIGDNGGSAPSNGDIEWVN